MTKRPERPKSLVPFYMYRGQGRTPALSRINARSILVWGVALVLIGLVGWLYLLQASQVATYAHEIRTLQLSTERIHRENIILTGQVAELGSLARIRQAGEQLGYSLPGAGYTARRMPLVYEPMPTPTADTGATTNAASSTSATTSESSQPSGRRLFDRFKAQLDEWLHSARPAASGE
jgi:hypothetical protein